MGSADRASLRGLTTRTDGLSMVFIPPTVRKACGEEHANEFAQPEDAWKICAASPVFEGASGPSSASPPAEPGRGHVETSRSYCLETLWRTVIWMIAQASRMAVGG